MQPESGNSSHPTRPSAPPGSVPPKLQPGKSPRRGVVLVILVLVALAIWLPQLRQRPTPSTPNWPPPRNNGFRPNPTRQIQVQPLRPRPAQKPPVTEIVTGPRAAPPRFLTPGGIRTSGTSVELAAPTAAAKIRYTLDGSEPTMASPEYTGAIAVSIGTQVKAKAFEPGLAPSITVSQTYTLLDPSLAEFTSNLPLVIISIFGQQLQKEVSVPASLRIIEPGQKRSALTAPASFDGSCDIKLRGFSSLRQPKRSFSLKTKNEADPSAGASILGLPKDSDWVLYAPYSDKTLMRDVLAYELSNKMGHWAAHTRFVEVFLDRGGGKLTKRDYVGVYVFEEKIKRSKDRVNIQKLTPEDKAEPGITGGYIFKRDHTSGPMDGPFMMFGQNQILSSGDEIGFSTSRGLHLLYVEPKEADITPEQKAWLSRYLNQFEKALYGPGFRSSTDGYAKYLDVDSFIDQFWIVELSRNVDGFRYSCYMTKDRSGKIRLEPIWDWNLSFGNANYHQGWMTENWYWPLLRETEVSWFRRLKQDPDFIQRLTDRWAELRKKILAPETILARIDELSDELSEAQARNFQRWPILGQQVNPNWYVGSSYQEEVEWMKNWIQERMAWIDSQFLAPPTLARSQNAKSKLTLQASAGEIYYTTDGTDPRAPGGMISPNAREYSEPIQVQPGMQLFARSHTGNAWSGPTMIKPGPVAAK